MKGKINYFIIQYGWALTISAFIIFLIPIGFYRHTGSFHLKKKFQPTNKPPIILVHTSDPHLSSIKPKSYPHIKNMFNKSKNIYKPDLLIISGDLTDNFISAVNVRPYYMQYEPDWILYNQLMEELNFTILKSENENSHRKEDIYLNSKHPVKTIQIIGNHDLFCVGAFNSSYNYLRNTIEYDNIMNFELSTTTLNFIDKKNNDDKGFSIKFVNLNRFSFPVGPIAFIQISFLTNRFKQRLLKELEKSDESQMTIVVSHIPVLRYHLIRDIEKILKSSHNTRFFLSGHWHPYEGFYMHVGRNVYELVAPPLFKSSNINLIFIDNGVSSNYLINLDQPEFAFITHPTSIYSKSDLDAYSPSSGEIRAVVFGKKSYLKNYTITIDNGFTGQLNCPQSRKIKEDVYLCTLQYENLKEGVHTLFKSGDWSGNLTFSIGPDSPSVTEYPYINEPQTSWTIWLIISWIATVYIIWPFKANSNKPFHREKSANQFNSEKTFLNCICHFFHSNKIVKSFITIKSRIHMLPLYFQRILLVEVLWCMFLPISFFDTEGKIGIFHVLGNFFYLGNEKSDEHYTYKENCLQNFKIGNFEYRYHYMGAMYGIYFLYFHVFPLFLIISEFISSQGQNNAFFVIDILVFILSFWGAYYQFSWLVDMFGIIYALASPLMLWFPVSLYICLIIWILNEIKMNNIEDSTELSQSLLYQVSV